MILARRDEEGGVFPVFLVAILLCFSMTIVLLHVGRGGDLRSRAQAAADAAALAAVANIRDRALHFLANGFTAYGVRFSRASATAARSYAKENGATVTSVDYRGLFAHTAIVKVKTNDTLGGIFKGLAGGKAHAKAIATVDFPSCGPVFGKKTNPKPPPPVVGWECDGIVIPIGAPNLDKFIRLFHIHLVSHAPPKYALPLPRRGGPTAPAGSADLCAQVASRAGFSGRVLVTAVAVALAESSCDPHATNGNTNGSVDYGLWQINSVHGYPTSCLFDAQCNANAAYRISSGGTNFYPWCTYEPPSCGNNGTASYRSHIAQARAAVARLGKGK